MIGLHSLALSLSRLMSVDLSNTGDQRRESESARLASRASEESSQITQSKSERDRAEQ